MRSNFVSLIPYWQSWFLFPRIGRAPLCAIITIFQLRKVSAVGPVSSSQRLSACPSPWLLEERSLYSADDDDDDDQEYRFCGRTPYATKSFF
jgi:hypothetical protein